MQSSPIAPMTLDSALTSLLSATGKGGSEGEGDDAALFARLLDNGLGETVERHNEGQQTALQGDSDEGAPLALRRLAEQSQRGCQEAGLESKQIGTADGLTNPLHDLSAPEAQTQRASAEVETDETGAGDLDPLTRLLSVDTHPANTAQSGNEDDPENAAAPIPISGTPSGLATLVSPAITSSVSPVSAVSGAPSGLATLVSPAVTSSVSPVSAVSGAPSGLATLVSPAVTSSVSPVSAVSGAITKSPGGENGATPEVGNLAGESSEQYEQIFSGGGITNAEDGPAELVIKAAVASGPGGDSNGSPVDKPKTQAGGNGASGNGPAGGVATFTQTAAGARQLARDETALAQAGNPGTAPTTATTHGPAALTLGPGFEAMADPAWQQRLTALNSSTLLASLDFGFGAQTLTPNQFSQGQGGFGGGFGSHQGGDGQTGDQSGEQAGGQSRGKDGVPSKNQFTQSLDLFRRGGDQLDMLFHKSDPNRSAYSQINFAVQRALQSGQSQFMLQLNPKELGQIEVRMQFEQNRLKLKVIIERADTMEFFKADSSLLEQMFQDAGIESSVEDFEFTHAGADPENEPQSRQDGSGTAAERSQQPALEALHPPVEPRRWTPMGISFVT